MKKKVNLAKFPRFATLFINPDKSPEVRRTKGTFRRIAHSDSGRSRGSLQGQLDILAKIPTPQGSKRRPEAKKNDIAETLNTANVEPTRSQDFKLPNVAYGPDVKIKATKAGLTFSGLTETCLNVHPCDFVYPGQACISTEQGIQHQINSY